MRKKLHHLQRKAAGEEVDSDSDSDDDDDDDNKSKRAKKKEAKKEAKAEATEMAKRSGDAADGGDETRPLYALRAKKMQEKVQKVLKKRRTNTRNMKSLAQRLQVVGILLHRFEIDEDDNQYLLLSLDKAVLEQWAEHMGMMLPYFRRGVSKKIDDSGASPSTAHVRVAADISFLSLPTPSPSRLHLFRNVSLGYGPTAEMVQERRPFKVSDRKNFRPGKDAATGLRVPIFTSAIRQKILMDKIRTKRNVENPTGGGAFIELGVEELKETVADWFFIHSQKDLEVLRQGWASAKKLHKLSQPLDRVRDYFGESIAFYFAWLGFYNKMLLMGPVPFGFLIALIATQTGEKTFYGLRDSPTGFYSVLQSPALAALLVAIFSVLMIVWATAFLELWKRRSAVLAYRWDMVRTPPYPF